MLSRVPAERLSRAIGPQRIQVLADLLEGSDATNLEESSALLARCAVGLFGMDALSERPLRRLLLETLPPELLAELAAEFTGNVLPKYHDNALALAATPWRAGSLLVERVLLALNLPRECAPPSAAGATTVEIVDPIDPVPALHAFQHDVYRQLLAHLTSLSPSVLVQLPTGAGKTRTVMEALIAVVDQRNVFGSGRSVAWIAHTEELCEQAIEAFKNLWQAKASSSSQVVRLWANHVPSVMDVQGAFVVATFQKLVAARESTLFRFLKSNLEVVVVDEAHKVLAPTFREVTSALSGGPGCSLVGLTATPGRGLDRQRENQELASLFNHNLVTPDLGANPLETLRGLRVLAQVHRRVIETGVTLTLSAGDQTHVERAFDLPKSILETLSHNPSRNRVIVENVATEVAAGNPCVVFACTVEHARLLAAALTLRGVPAEYIDSTMRKGARRSVIERFRRGDFQVLTNFGILSTGFDAPRIRTVVIARPTASVVLYSQMVGRGLRGPLMGGGDRCTLVDVRDNFENFGSVDDVYRVFDGFWTAQQTHK